MNNLTVLIIGGGGREAALVRKIKSSPLVGRVLCAPGNAGIAQDCACHPLKVGELDKLLDLARHEQVDLTVVGPEAPLVAGIVDRFAEVGLAAFGPTRAASEIEASKHWSAELRHRHGIPSARYEVFSGADQAEAARCYAEHILREHRRPVVIKADGLCAGKGVIVAHDTAEAFEAISAMLRRRIFGAAGDTILIEEFLEGRECSLMVLVDGQHVVPLAPARDYKRAGDGDTGPNTGGMGSYSPVPDLTPELYGRCLEEIVQPTVRAMQQERVPFDGLLYVGLMLTADGPKVLEYNCRFGDPETQVVLARMQSDLVPYLLACTDGSLDTLMPPRFESSAAVCVVVAAAGYPGEPIKGAEIRQLEGAKFYGEILHAGTAAHDGKIVTNGGRVLNVVGVGRDFGVARTLTYNAVRCIEFEGAWYRRDIALAET